MPVSTLVVTAGAANANAYTTVATADQFHLDRPTVGTTVVSGLWSAASADQKTAAILWATKLLDKLMYWNGYVTDPSQSLMWPRLGLYKPNGLAELDSTTIPNEIQWATAEYARQLLMSDRMGDSLIEAYGLKLIKAGPIRLDFKDGVYAKPIPDAVENLIPSAWGYLQEDTGIWEKEVRRA